MKKSLSLVLALAMVFTMFASVAFAADATTTASTDAQTKFEALKDKGIMTGTVVDGQVVAGLDLNMDRASFAEVLVNLYNLPKVATTSSFSDVPADHWALQQIEAAKTAGYMLGNGDGTFNPDGKITLQELASALCEANGLEPVANAEVAGADDWAAGYVAAAVNAKLLASVSDYTAAATRADLVVGTYGTYENVQAEQAPTATFAATGASKITVTFNKAIDKAKATFVVKKGSLPINISSTTVADDNMSATLNLATKLTKGDYTVTVTNPELSGTVTVADDEKVAKITFTSDKAPLARVPVTFATDYNNVYAFIKVFNQYNEDITSSKAAGLTVTTGSGTIAAQGSDGKITINNSTTAFSIDQKIAVSALDVSSATFASSVLTVAAPAQAATINIVKLADPSDDTNVPQVNSNASDFKLYITANDQYGNPVDAASLKQDTIVSVTNPSVSDVDKTGVAPSQLPAFVDDADSDQITLALASTDASGEFKTAGTSQIILISKTTGNRASFDVTVKDAVKVDTLSVSAPTVAVAGESFDIPFQAVDQFGAAITNADTLNATGAFASIQISGGTPIDSDTSNVTYHGKAAVVSFVPDYVNDTAKLTVDAGNMTSTDDSVQTLFFSAVTSTGKLVTLNIAVQPAAKPTVVTGVTDDTKKAIADGGATSIEVGNINVLDQYNREHTADEYLSDYNVYIETSNSDVVGINGTSDNVLISKTGTVVTNGTVNLNANDTGSATITINLQDKNDSNHTVANSDVTFSVKVVNKDDITDYSVADIGTLYAKPASNTNPDYAKTLDVSGLLADGTEVALTNDGAYYTVTVDTYGTGVTYTQSTGKLSADTSVVDSDADDITVPVTVVAQTNSGTKIISKNFTLSGKDPVAKTVALADSNDTNGISKESDTVVSITATKLHAFTSYQALANAAVDVTDQYGVNIATTTKFTPVISTNFTSDGDAIANEAIADTNAGDTFYVTAITPNGLVSSFKVIVK